MLNRDRSSSIAGSKRPRSRASISRLSLAVAATVAAAGGVVATASASSSHKTLKSIEFVNPLPDSPVWREIGVCMANEAKKLKIPFSQTGPGGEAVNTQFMITRLDQAIADKVGAVVTFPVSAPEFNPIFEQARKKGLLVATVEGAHSTTGQNVDVGTSYVAYGQLAAKTVSEKKGTQYVGFIEPSDTPPASTFVNAFIKAAKQYKNIHIVTTEYDQGNSTNDVDIATNMMTANPELNMFVTNNGLTTPGVISAIKSTHQVGHVFLTTDNVVGTLAGFKAGIVYSTLVQNMCQIGTLPVTELAAVAAGRKVPAEVPTSIKFATKGDVKQLTASGEYQ